MPITTLPPRPTWAGSRLDAEHDAAARVVENPLTGAIPTWRLDEEPAYLATVAERGDPSREALDARITPLPVAPAGIVEGSLVDGPPTMPLALAPTAVLPVLAPAAARPARKPRKRAAS